VRRIVFALVLLAASAHAQELEPPRLIERVEAPYPPEAARLGLNG
jgi:hypothetical protein